MWHVVFLFCKLSIPADQCNPATAYYQSPMTREFDSEEECEPYAKNVGINYRPNDYIKGVCEQE
jgi:hypothetical protein